MQVAILNGVYTDTNPDFRTIYPRNLIPVPKQQGISSGYLRPAEGVVKYGDAYGKDRGAINWNGVCYRVSGSSLMSIDAHGRKTYLGIVSGIGQVSMSYGFDRLAIASGGDLYYLQGSDLTKVTDPDIGKVLDVLWVDGYFMTTDGSSLVVTELNDPTQVNPLKYGSSEADPDKIQCMKWLRDEVYAVNRYTIEVFDNTGGPLFPFTRVQGAIMQRGAVGTHAAAVFMEAIAFVGSARNEAPAVYIGKNATTMPISTREIEQILASYSDAQLAEIVVEVVADKHHQLLLIHLPDKTLVYDGIGSMVMQEPVWFTLDSGIETPSQYRARNWVWCYGKWLVGDPTSAAYGYMDGTVGEHYGDTVGWEFGTMIAYNEGNGAIIHELELVSLTGRVKAGTKPVVWTSYTLDGQDWSQERPANAGGIGDTKKRITWFQQGYLRNFRTQKFRGTSDAHISFARLEARVEALNG